MCVCRGGRRGGKDGEEVERVEDVWRARKGAGEQRSTGALHQQTLSLCGRVGGRCLLRGVRCPA